MANLIIGAMAVLGGTFIIGFSIGWLVSDREHDRFLREREGKHG